MKEITRIHLARTPFNIEVEARKALEKYLAAIEKALGADEDTMREIEARVIEILAERGVSAERTITTGDEKAIEARLGSPSDFVDESAADPAKATEGDKRLMRDSEHGLLGGVCAGIAGYFGVNVMWPRLVAILLTFISFGTAILVYVVLWLVIPSAKTAAEKLQMRGEPVTLAALKEKASETGETPERSKPLVLALRIFLGLGFASAALAAVMLSVAAIFVREPLFEMAMHDLATTHIFSSVGIAYIAAIIAGLLFVVLMIMASYASFAWRVSKKLLVGGGIIIALGLVSFATAIGLGVQGAAQINQQIEQNKVTDTRPLSSELGTGLKQAAFTGPEQLRIEYHATNSAPRVETTYLRGQNKPQVSITRDGDQATISVARQDQCHDGLLLCAGVDRVVVYGPALDLITVKSGTLTYFAGAQSRLSATVLSDTTLGIEGGQIAQLEGRVDNGGLLRAEDATVSTANVTVAVNASVSFGALDTLALTTPKLCNGSTASVSYRSANAFTINDKSVTSVGESVPCVEVGNE